MKKYTKKYILRKTIPHTVIKNLKNQIGYEWTATFKNLVSITMKRTETGIAFSGFMREPIMTLEVPVKSCLIIKTYEMIRKELVFKYLKVKKGHEIH